MPRGFMDDLEGEVIGEEVHEGGFENRLPTGTWVRIPHPPPTKAEHLSTDKCSAFVYPSRRLGISSPHNVRCISSAPLGLYLITL